MNETNLREILDEERRSDSTTWEAGVASMMPSVTGARANVRTRKDYLSDIQAEERLCCATIFGTTREGMLCGNTSGIKTHRGHLRSMRWRSLFPGSREHEWDTSRWRVRSLTLGYSVGLRRIEIEARHEFTAIGGANHTSDYHPLSTPVDPVCRRASS